MDKKGVTRWTEKDKTIFWCPLCEMWHYKNSKIGKRHRKYIRGGGDVKEEKT